MNFTLFVTALLTGLAFCRRSDDFGQADFAAKLQRSEGGSL